MVILKGERSKTIGVWKSAQCDGEVESNVDDQKRSFTFTKGTTWVCSFKILKINGMHTVCQASA